VWAGWLPAERALAAELRVSRRTLRKALAHLRREGALRTSAARGHAILPAAAARKSRRDRDAQVVFLSPLPLEELRPFTVLWVDQLRSLFAERRVQLRMLAGKKFFGSQARLHLKRLVMEQPADAWLLAGSTETAQRWFQADGPPCVLAGSCHAGIDLPNVDLDYAALGQHAAGVLLAAGHRRIAMLMDRQARVGDTKTQAGFMRGIAATRGRDVEFSVATLPPDPAGIHKVLRRLLDRDGAPTALFVSRSSDYLSVLSSFLQLRRRIAEDISLLLRDDEPFLQSLFPAPNRYAFAHRVFAQRIGRLLMEALAKEPHSRRHVSVLPTYVPGGSLRAWS
jgi:LacI family transcriptional regulator